MRNRIAIALCSIAALTATFASAGTMKATFKYQIKVAPSFDVFNSWLVIGGGIYTKNASFDQLLSEAQNGRMQHSRSLGWVMTQPGNAPTTFTGSFVASTSSPTTTQIPVSGIGQIVRTMYAGIYNSPNGVEIAYDKVAGEKAIAAGAPWAGSSLPFLIPTSSSNGTVATYEDFQTEASVYNLLKFGTAAQVRAGLPGVMNSLSKPYDADGTPGYALAEFNQAETSTSPAQASLFRHNLPMTNRQLKLVKFSNATDGGDVEITISEPQENMPGDFDGDDLIDAADIDLLQRATPGSIPTVDGLFDLNADDQVITTADVPLSDTDVWVRTLRHTEYGDSTLDGNVDFSDLLVLAQNYGNSSEAGWSDGSFNGDGTVGFDDLLALAQHYGFGPTVTRGSDFDADWIRARSLVPEPVAGSTAMLIAFALKKRRR